MTQFNVYGWQVEGTIKLIIDKSKIKIYCFSFYTDVIVVTTFCYCTKSALDLFRFGTWCPKLILIRNQLYFKLNSNDILYN